MWSGLLRSDGMYVAPLDTENRWVILRPSGAIAYQACPCCDLPMKTERVAKLVADAVCPLPPEAA